MSGDIAEEFEAFAPMEDIPTGTNAFNNTKEEDNKEEKSNMGSRKSSALDELNQDGYFGHADGNWIEDDAAPLVLMQKSSGMDSPTLKEDLRELWNFYGRKIVVSMLAVGILIASIAIISMQTTTRTRNTTRGE